MKEIDIFKFATYLEEEMGVVADVAETSFGYNLILTGGENSNDIIYIDDFEVICEWAKMHNFTMSMTIFGKVDEDGETKLIFHIHKK
jgi:hypothetical protein